MTSFHIAHGKRYFARADNSPFFLLGDTAWELFHRLSFEEADFYLQTRANQGFNTIYAVALAEFEGLREPNREGFLPFRDFDPAQPIEPYWSFVDRVVARANELGLVCAMLPTWGDKWNKAWGVGPEVFTLQNARAYGAWLGRRYTHADVLWVLGGDRTVENETQRDIVLAMSAGLHETSDHLQTFHPPGRCGSSQFFPGHWPDFHEWQSGHSWPDARNDQSIAGDWAREPVKPTLDGEPRYEDHPLMGDNSTPQGDSYFDGWDARKALYAAVFAGAAGHVYGCHAVWQFYDPDRHPVVNGARTLWRLALQLSGATSMRHARALLESRPYFGRVPAPELLFTDANADPQNDARPPEMRQLPPLPAMATRDLDGAFVLVYCPSGRKVEVNLDALRGSARSAWLDPRSGESHPCGTFVASGRREFSPPTSGANCDWVLTLDA